MGYGFNVNTQLSRLCRCEHDFKAGFGGWVVRVDSRQATTTPNVFAAGEATGIGAADVAVAEGAIAGISAAEALSRIPKSEAQRRRRPHHKRLLGMRPFAQMMADLFTPKEGLLDITTPDTVVCRCEEVTADRIIQAVDNGAKELSGVKSRTRVGMGLCQGRVCGESVAALVARRTGRNPGGVGILHGSADSEADAHGRIGRHGREGLR